MSQETAVSRTHCKLSRETAVSRNHCKLSRETAVSYRVCTPPHPVPSHHSYLVLPYPVPGILFYLVSGIAVRLRRFLRKKFQSHIRHPISHGKDSIHFCRQTPHSLTNGHPEFIFRSYFGKYCFLKKNCHIKIFKTPFLTKKFILIFVARHPISLKIVMSSHKWFFLQSFQHKLKNIHEVFLLESILIRKKILWRINFVLKKFSPNALLFDKLQNESENPSFLHQVTSIRSDHAGAVAKFHIHGFIL